MSEANKELVRRWFEEVWNKQSEEAIDEMFAPQGKAYGFPEPEPVLVGPERFKSFHRAFLGAFPDIHITINDVICEDERVAVTWTANMTHLGDSLGFEPTMQRVSLEGCSILIVRDSQIQDGWNYTELQALVQRLKVMAAQSEAVTETSTV